MASGRQRWFRQPSVLIAALALIVSISSTVVTIENNRTQTEMTSRNQLLTLVEGLAQVPQLESQIAATYKNNVQQRISVLGSETNAQLIQAEEAGQLIESLHGNVAPAAAYQVANAFSDQNEPKAALRYYNMALHGATASDPILAASTYRGEANVLYAMGNPAQAAVAIDHAYAAISPSGGYSHTQVIQNRIFTDLFDVNRAVNARECTRAQGDIRDAEKWIPSLSRASASYIQDSQQLSAETPFAMGCR